MITDLCESPLTRRWLPAVLPGSSCANAVAAQGVRHVGKAAALELIDLHLTEQVDGKGETGDGQHLMLKKAK